MLNQKRIEVNPNDIMAPVYEVLGEGTSHVDEFTDQPGYEWRIWCQDRVRMIPLIRQPLLDYWRGLSPLEKAQLKLTLQYILNVDASAPYEPWAYAPELKSKAGGVGEKYFASYQDAIQPYDWYELCLWMWDILFSDLDWHADVKDWVITDNATLYTKL